MAEYMIKASFSTEDLEGLMEKAGSARADAIGKLAASVRGSVDSGYCTFGVGDIVVILEVPGHEAMAAIAGRSSRTGAPSKYETDVQLTPARSARLRA